MCNNGHMTATLEKEKKISPPRPHLILRTELDSELGGVRECADLLGISRASICSSAKRRRTTGFPSEVARWRMGPVYLINDVEAWYDGKAASPWPVWPKRINRADLIDVRDIQDSLGGVREIASMCSVTDNQATTWISRSEVNHFPSEVARWAMGPVRDLDEVWNWFEAYDPTKVRIYRWVGNS